jgi:hypothetical protein
VTIGWEKWQRRQRVQGRWDICWRGIELGGVMMGVGAVVSSLVESGREGKGGERSFQNYATGLEGINFGA